MSRLKLAALAAASTAAVLATAARADDAKPESDAVELDKVTVTATRSEKALSKAPASVTVISAQEIEDGLIKDIKDLDTALQTPKDGIHVIELDEVPYKLYLDAKQAEQENQVLLPQRYRIRELKRLE